MTTFHQSHFGNDATSLFGNGFMNLAATNTGLSDDNQVDGSWEEDDLGYYEDGVKRTLTDEQIEIFRHSELRELERTKEKAARSNKTDDKEATETTGSPQTQNERSSASNSRNRKKNKMNKQPRREPKPDLRKRTWDVVEAGLDSLDYD